MSRLEELALAAAASAPLDGGAAERTEAAVMAEDPTGRGVEFVHPGEVAATADLVAVLNAVVGWKAAQEAGDFEPESEEQQDDRPRAAPGAAGLDEGGAERVALRQDQDAEYEAGLARDLMLAAAQKRSSDTEAKADQSAGE